jgi:hypothetical protein
MRAHKRFAKEWIMTHELSQRKSLAIEACRATREDAVAFLRCISEGGDTYFDRPDKGADVDVTREHASFFQTVIHRKDVALAALEGDAPAEANSLA